MKTPEEILDEIYDRDYRSNYKTSYSKQCIVRAMREYGEQCRVEDKKKLLTDFFLYFRENGEKNIGQTIEQFVNEYLKNGE